MTLYSRVTICIFYLEMFVFVFRNKHCHVSHANWPIGHNEFSVSVEKLQILLRFTYILMHKKHPQIKQAKLSLKSIFGQDIMARDY